MFHHNILLQLSSLFLSLFISSMALAQTNWDFETLLQLFEPGSMEASLTGQISSTLLSRQCHKLTGCSKWTLSKNPSPQMILRSSVYYGEGLKDKVGQLKGDDYSRPLDISKLSARLKINDFGQLEFVLTGGQRIKSLQEMMTENPYFEMPASFNMESQKFNPAFISISPVQFDLTEVQNCSMIGYRSMCDTGYYLDQGKLVDEKGVVLNQVPADINIVDDHLIIIFNNKTDLAANGLWKESQWQIKVPLKNSAE